MNYVLLCIFTAIGIYAYVFYYKVKERNNKKEKTNEIQKKFVYNKILYPSIYQVLILSENNDIFTKMYTILTLKKDFCLSQLLFSEQKETLILKAYLSQKTPNFYADNKKLGSLHYCKNLQEKSYSINNYICSGQMSEKIRNFCKNYNFFHFYCSYWPLQKNLTNPNNIPNSVVYLECDLLLLDDTKFIDDFFDCFFCIQEESQKNINCEKILLQEKMKKIEEYEKKDFVEKIANEINKNASKTTLKKYKTKKAKK